MNVILVEKMIQMMAKVCEADGFQGSFYFYWFYNDLGDLYKKEEEPLAQSCAVCWGLWSTTALGFSSSQQDI